MDQTQFQQYCRAQGLTPEACDLIARIRLSQPVRRVQGRAGNVCGFYPSRKMGVTIQFESQSVELGAIYLMDHDEAVLEFYDQPHTFKLKYLDKTGKRMLGPFYTPDFLVLRKSGVVFEEWKTEDELLKLAEKQPYRYQRGEDGSWHCPPAEAFAQSLGLSFRVCSSALLPRTYIDNLDFLADYFITPPHLPETVVSLILDRVQASPGITIAALLGGLQVCGPMMSMRSLQHPRSLLTSISLPYATITARGFFLTGTQPLPTRNLAL